MDDDVSRNGSAGWEPSLVGLGSGRCVQKSEERRQNGDEKLRQKDAQTDQRPRTKGVCCAKLH